MEVTINYNGQAVAVEVTLEVYEFLDRADHKTENLFHEQRRHWDGRELFLLDKRAEAARERKMFRYKAFYSLDCNDGIENAAIGWAQPSPAPVLCASEMDGQSISVSKEKRGA